MTVNQLKLDKSTILVVDDAPSNLQLLHGILSKRGYQVQLAADGVEALQVAQTIAPDLILLDIQMPELDGYQVCEQLKANEQTRSIPIIFLSVTDEVADKVKAFAMGAADFMSKPFATQELVARIEHQLRLRTLQAELNQQKEQLLQQNQQFQQQSQILSTFSHSLKHLHRLNITDFKTVESLIADYIKTGCHVLNFSAGAVGQIQDDSYTFLAVQSDIKSLVPNLTVKLSDAYCGKVAEQQQTVTFDHVGEMEDMRCHPLYQSLRLESYIGTPIVINGELYGTLCFFSQQPRPQGFKNHEQEIIELMAQSMGKYIANRQTETELSSLFVAMTDAVIVRDITGRCLKISPTSPNLYKPAAEMIGKTLHETLPTETADLLLSGIQSSLATGQTIDLEYSLVIQETLVWLSACISPLFEDSVIIVARDITARKQMEEALRQSEIHNRALLEAIPDLLVRLDKHGYYLAYKPPSNFKNLCKSDDHIGKHLSDVLPPDMAQRQLHLIQHVLATGEHQRTEQQFVLDGETFYEEIRAVMINPDEVMMMIRDVSDRRRAESALQRAKEEAELANQTKSEFLANMSHELRTPLNAVLGFTQLIMREYPGNSTVKEYLNIINRSGAHLLTLINDVLEMSRIEAGRVSLNVSSFDLHHLLGNLEDMLRLKAESKGLTLICDLAPDLPHYVQTDEGKLRQVLINLLGNAVKFTNEGGVALRVRSQGSGDDGPGDDEPGDDGEASSYPSSLRLYFEIEDTGSGITPDELETLFEPFVQTKQGQLTHEGTGLGLAISQTFVQLMGGNIQLNSVPHQGTLVKFDIQIALGQQANIQLQPVKSKAIALAPEQPRYRILVVEDHWANRQLLIQLLRSLNFNVQAAINGQEALHLWQTWQPHLIWMDMRMPVMDGYEATRQIRAAEAEHVPPRSTKIIALTASAFEEDHAQVLLAGCDAFVSKPFREDVILETMATQLGVHYLYEEPDETLAIADDNTRKPSLPPDASSLEEIPSEWIEQLQSAAIRGSDQRLLQLIDQLSSTHACLAQNLTEWVNNFRFDKIINFIQNSKKTSK
jgi:PAS domain S-box-containing protein